MVPEGTDASLSKVYDPHGVESRLYAQWREAGYFMPSQQAKGPSFAIVLPPPNVTGRLHMGHALTATIQDCLVRWHRMCGDDVLWIPGTDHAGISTQVMVERALAAENTTRQALGREKFLERTWVWKETHGGTIDRQHERLGASLDWSRYRFTMDPQSSRAVREAFCRLYEEGLIYRAYRLINWDYASQTALSDLEVEHREIEGSLWHLAYPIEDSEERLTVATTRPETMLGDSGVAVHPEDPRYRHLIGKHVVLPLTGRRVPIVGDAVLVDMAFGTGAVKVTPAHDFNDFETGKRHGLEVICVIDTQGKICPPAPSQFVGLGVAEARRAVVDALRAQGSLVDVRPHKLNLGYSQRTGVVVEPLPSHQWFVAVRTLADKAMAAVRGGETHFIPEHRSADFFRWMEGIHDWCISRQLWWGHRIPAWYCDDCHAITVAREDPHACRHCTSAAIRQDEDVLDTWFSSGLWPLTTLGWPQDTADLRRFYPNALMETGWDILFFWVARMMMFGCHFLGKAPFATVMLHGMVLGEDGQKMAKMRGNVVDPLELVEAYGADALRFYLCTMAGQETGIVFSRARVEGYRNFCNKLWNASRFAALHLERGVDWPAYLDTLRDLTGYARLSLSDRWILAKLAECVQQVDEHLASFRIDLAAQSLYHFVWYELCDWYLEAAKLHLQGDDATAILTRGTLCGVFDTVLRLLHPMMPFITEELWQRLPNLPRETPSLMLARFPRPAVHPTAFFGDAAFEAEQAEQAGFAAASTSAVEAFELVRDVVSTGRMLKAEYGVAPGRKVELWLRSGDVSRRKALEELEPLLRHLGRLQRLHVLAPDAEIPRQAASQAVHGIEVVLPLADLIDIAEERQRLTKSIAKLDKDLAALERKLQPQEGGGFLQKAPPEVVAAERARLNRLRDDVAKQKALLQRLEA